MIGIIFLVSYWHFYFPICLKNNQIHCKISNVPPIISKNFSIDFYWNPVFHSTLQMALKIKYVVLFTKSYQFFIKIIKNLLTKHLVWPNLHKQFLTTSDHLFKRKSTVSYQNTWIRRTIMLMKLSYGLTKYVTM